jgi:hypothetical protein
MRMRTFPNGVRRVLLLCCGLLGLGVPAMPLVGDHDRTETSSREIAEIKIGKPVLHRLGQNKGCIIADEEDGEKLARLWHLKKYVCIPYGIVVSEGPVPRFESPVAFGQWFKEKRPAQVKHDVIAGNQSISLLCSYFDYLIYMQDVHMKSYSLNGTKLSIDMEIDGWPWPGFHHPYSEWVPLLEIPIRGLPEGDYEIEVFWRDKSERFKPNPTAGQWVYLHVHRPRGSGLTR